MVNNSKIYLSIKLVEITLVYSLKIKSDSEKIIIFMISQ